ncbi:hypothetical protein HID58_075772 [Brassica napus]|uniref:Uncharacterized protein n=1 Tax=Brassica napus TaxID=3708 RepID=A0ABQ7YKK7_BRANA|nr:hypothetical protein HID58_075772 [Brassica napus]
MGLWFLPTSLLRRPAHEVSFSCGVRQSLESRQGVGLSLWCLCWFVVVV